MGVDPSSIPSNLKRDNGLFGSLTTNVKRLPGDVYAVAAYAVFAEPLVTGFMAVPQAVRVSTALPLVLFLPGYVVLSVLYPGTTPAVDETRWLTLAGKGLRWPDRLVLSFGTSIAMIPLFGLLLSGLALGLTGASVGTTLVVFVLVGALAGGLRRLQLAPADRYSVPVGSLVHELDRALIGRDRLDSALNATLLILVLIGVVGMMVAFIVPPAGESYTNFYLLSETEDGTLVASGFPEELVVGGQAEIVVGIDNHEADRTAYTVVAELQRVQIVDNDVEVLERNRAGSFERVVPAGESVQVTTTIEPTIAGEDLRLVYYLYRGSTPDDPADAYRSVFIWLTIVEG